VGKLRASSCIIDGEAVTCGEDITCLGYPKRVELARSFGILL
jgi:hypothetical protein